ncbi:hypothetical protein [Nonomuraea composti]|uniref:hypothetical protein n=1 Tax=Nonomuraea composti TaxID=2720023 RepID=UPI00197E0BEC|nr:hypothetical protein [Nonomuraea sp. FMUSA5-5]
MPRRSAEVDDALRLTSFDGPGAAEAPAGAEFLLTGWGCPRIDARITDRRAPAAGRPAQAGHDRALRQPGDGTGLHDRTVGVIGASRIGRLVLQRLRASDVREVLPEQLPYTA